MMQDALWLPEYPPENLHFSDISSYGGDLLSGYQLFMWTLFGNKDGSRLSFLTRSDVGNVWGNRFYVLRFYYNNESKYSSDLDLGGD